MTNMKITSYEQYVPIILGFKDAAIIPTERYGTQSTIGELKDRFRITIFSKDYLKTYETRDKSFIVGDGVIWYKDYNMYNVNNQFKYLLIICYNTITKNYEALINEYYLECYPGHKSFINAFIKQYGLSTRKDIVYKRPDYLRNFEFKVSDKALQKLSHPDNQIRFIKEFKKQQVWKIPSQY